MCRILAVRAASAFDIDEQLAPFAALSKASREYQGHGWGCAWHDGTAWQSYHNIAPIWEDPKTGFGETRLLLVHARSAFRDEGIMVENNMPFTDGEWMFVFNGELRGVRIREEGRIGAEKMFNYIRRFRERGTEAMLETGTRIIKKRTRYVRAMNIFMSDGNDVLVSSDWSEDPEYFQMHRTVVGDRTIVCSDPWPFGLEADTVWEPIENGAVFSLPA